MRCAILGTGKMGGTVGRQLARAGHEVIFGSRAPERHQERFAGLDRVRVASNPEAAALAEVIIVAVPWAYARDLLRGLRTAIAGKTVIDLTNPLSPDVSQLAVGGDDSAAEQLAAVVPEAHVVKAMNMITADNFATPSFSGAVAQSWYCGDDGPARATAHALIAACGYEPVYCGALTNARYLEAAAMLWLQLAFWEDWGPGFSIRMQPVPPVAQSVPGTGA